MDPRKEVEEFEGMLGSAKLRALSKTSLERPLTAGEFKEMKELAQKEGIPTGD